MEAGKVIGMKILGTIHLMNSSIKLVLMPNLILKGYRQKC